MADQDDPRLRAHARRQLENLVIEAGRARIRAGTVSDLLDQWLEAASPGWSASTVSHTRSIVDCHLKPHLGYLDLGKLTTADIGDFYAHLVGLTKRRSEWKLPARVSNGGAHLSWGRTGRASRPAATPSAWSVL